MELYYEKAQSFGPDEIDKLESSSSKARKEFLHEYLEVSSQVLHGLELSDPNADKFFENWKLQFTRDISRLDRELGKFLEALQPLRLQADPLSENMFVLIFSAIVPLSEQIALIFWNEDKVGLEAKSVRAQNIQIGLLKVCSGKLYNFRFTSDYLTAEDLDRIFCESISEFVRKTNNGTNNSLN